MSQVASQGLHLQQEEIQIHMIKIKQKSSKNLEE